MWRCRAPCHDMLHNAASHCVIILWPVTSVAWQNIPCHFRLCHHNMVPGQITWDVSCHVTIVCIMSSDSKSHHIWRVLFGHVIFHMRCDVMRCHAIPYCDVMPYCVVVSRHVISRYIISHHITLWDVVSSRVIRCDVVSCDVVSYSYTYTHGVSSHAILCCAQCVVSWRVVCCYSHTVTVSRHIRCVHYPQPLDHPSVLINTFSVCWEKSLKVKHKLIINHLHQIITFQAAWSFFNKWCCITTYVSCHMALCRVIVMGNLAAVWTGNLRSSRSFIFYLSNSLSCV